MTKNLLRFNRRKVIIMNTEKFTNEEKVLFYKWLNGDLKSQQNKMYSLVFCLCPSCRDVIIKEFLENFNAQHRYSAMRNALQIDKSKFFLADCSC